MGLDINGVNGVNRFEQTKQTSGETTETKLNCVFGDGYHTAEPAQRSENKYFTDSMIDGKVSFNNSFLKINNTINFKVGENETLAQFCKKTGFPPETIMDNIVGGGADLNCKAPMGPDGNRFINISENDLAKALGKSQQEIRKMFT